IASGSFATKTTLNYFNEISTPGSPASCGGFSMLGADKFYSLTVPAGQTLTVNVMPATGFDPGIYLLPSCASTVTSCLAGADVNASGGIETFVYTNSSGASQNLILVVDRFSNSSPGGSYSMTVNIQ